AEAALLSFEPPIVLIAGGQDKGMDASRMTALAAERAGTVLLIGKTRERLRDEIVRRGGKHISCCDSLEEAVAAAETAARPGATVLFSPGFASYDMFSSFEERGERFRALTRALPG